MTTAAWIEQWMNAEIESADSEKLEDISTIEYDYSLPADERPAHVLERLKNPLCYRCGETGIKLAFDDTAPPIQEVLIHLILRKKSFL